MRIALRTSIALILTACVPMVLSFLIGTFFWLADIFDQVSAGTLLANLDDLLLSFLGLVLIDILMVAPVSFGHVFCLGLPLLLLSWQFRAIRSWSTLLLSFVIGAVPSVLFWFFYLTLRWKEGFYFLQMENMTSSNLAITVALAIIMGGFGFSGGLVFWFLWRYWVSPESPHGRPVSELPVVGIQPLSHNP